MKNEKGIALIVIVIIIILALIIGITGRYVENQVDYGEKEGIIIDKEYTEAYTTTYFTYINKVMIPHTIYNPESYKIKIKKESEGKEKTIWISVDKDTYNKLNKYDYYK